MTSIVERFEALARSMRSDERFTDVVFRRNKPLPADDIEMVASSRIRVSDDVLAVYREANGFAFNWRLRPRDRHAVEMGEEPWTCGEVNLPGFLPTFLYRWARHIAPPGTQTASADETELRYQSLVSRLAPFDVAQDTCDGTRAAVFEYDKDALRKAATEWQKKHLKKKPRAKDAPGVTLTKKQAIEVKLRVLAEALAAQPPFEPKLWFWNEKGPKFPLTLGLVAYLEQALLTRGLSHWQSYFCHCDGFDLADPLLWNLSASLSTDVPRLREAHGFLVALFSDVDPAPFAARLAHFASRAPALDAAAALHRPG